MATSLMLWAQNRPVDDHQTKIAVLESADLLEPLRNSGFMQGVSVAFYPEGQIVPEELGSEVSLFTFQGDFKEPDSDVRFGPDFYLQQQTYALAEFVPVAGPTVLWITGDADRTAFFRDADHSFQTGGFRDHLIHPQAVLGDPAATVGPQGDKALHSIYVSADRHVSTSPFGLPLGYLADGPEAWASRFSTHEAHEASARPWLPRYLHVVEALRFASARGMAAMRVAGFGGHLVPGLSSMRSDEGQLAPDRPVLLYSAMGAHLHDPRSSRTYRLGTDAARVVDIMLAIPRVTGEAAGDLLGCGVSAAEQAINRIREQFSAQGVHFDIESTVTR